MDPLLLRYYEEELQHVRQMGGEFAKAYPKIAGRLGLEGFECADPYVERLLEGFAFLAARIQLKIDAEFPNFTQQLLEMVYPHYLAPTPSMAIVELTPDPKDTQLTEGFSIPRDTALLSALGKSEQTRCEYRTAHDVTLWPVQLVEARYFTRAREMPEIKLPGARDFKAGLRLRLRATAGLTFNQIAMDSLVLYIRGSGGLPNRIYEQLLANGIAIAALPTQRPAPWCETVDQSHIRRVGFAQNEALLPYDRRSFSGYRLLQEYFALPERYRFVELRGLGTAVRRCEEAELDVVVLLNNSEPALEKSLDESNFALYCTPALNLFPKRADRIHLSTQTVDYHVVPDRSRPMDFEVYGVTGVEGYGTSSEQAQAFKPFYTAKDPMLGEEEQAYFTVQRRLRVYSERQRRKGGRSSYLGGEVFVSLVDARAAPYRTDLRQLGVGTRCTNRDLPLHMPVGQGATDFTMEISAPIEAVRCLKGPTAPRASHVHGEAAWRLISHLSLNYLSLSGADPEQNAAALRELLAIYGEVSDPVVRQQIEGIQSVEAKAIIDRIPAPGPIMVGRGLQITLKLDESAFEGAGAFLLGAVLEEFFARYVAINSFTRTTVKTLERGEIMAWPTRIGRRETL